MRILVLHSGGFEHFLSAARAVAARYPGSVFVGLVREPDVARAAETGVFAELHLLPGDLRRVAALPIWDRPVDACLVPFEDRLGVYYWTFRWVPIRHRIPLVLTYDRRGWLREWSRPRWIANTLAVCLVIRAVHEPGLRAWNALRPRLDVTLLFGLAAGALCWSALRTLGLARPRRGADESGPAGRRRLVLFIPSLGVGGAQRQLASFLAHLDRNRWEPELVMLDMPDKFFEPAIRALGVPIRYLNPQGDYWMCGVVWRLTRHLRAHPCDVLHSWLHYAAALGAIAGSLAGVPTVVGSLRSERPGRFPWFYPKWQRAIDILTAPLQTTVIANSKAVREENRRWALIPARKLVTVYNGIDMDRAALASDEALARLRQALGLPQDVPVVGIVGRLYPEKDHATFLNAARHVAAVRPDAHFLIVGDGTLRGWIESEVTRLRLAGRVHLLGSRKDASALIQLMDVSVLTSTSEGFPNVLLEAAVAGTPVVTTAAGGAAEVVVDGETGFVVPCGDGEAVGRRVLELLADPDLRRRFAGAARQRAQTFFSARRAAAAIEASYLGRRAAARRAAVEDRDQEMPRSRICFISPYAYGVLRPSSGLPVGGAEVQICRLARELAQDPRLAVTVLTGDGLRTGRERVGGCEVVISPLIGRHQSRGGASLDVVPIGGGAVIIASIRRKLALSPLGWLWRLAREGATFIRWLRLLEAVGADVYVMRCASPQVGAVQRVCALLGRRFVFQAAHEQDVDGGYARERGVWGKRFEAGLRRADVVVCQHAEQASLFRARYQRDGRVIRSLCPVPVCDGIPQAERRTILWMARMDRWKQPELFLDLAARMPDRSFVMVCPASETEPVDPDMLRTRMAGLPNLRWLPGLPFDEAARLFGEAMLFVNTSQAEGFPNTFLQAMAAGTPIVSWAVDPERVLARHRIGACADQDWTAFEQAVRLFCADAELRERWGENGQRYVRAHHDPAAIAGEYAELFLSLGEDRMAANIPAPPVAQALGAKRDGVMP